MSKALKKELVINASQLETKIALLENGQVNEIFIERRKNQGILGNIYKGRVIKVLPGMQAAFVDIGYELNAFLPFSEIGNSDYILEESSNNRNRGSSKHSRKIENIEVDLKTNQEIQKDVHICDLLPLLISHKLSYYRVGP